MTPREPDRFEAKAREVLGLNLSGSHPRVVRSVAAALRREREEALERAAQEYGAEDLANVKVYCRHVAQRLRELKSPAAAPAAEPDRVSRLLGRGHVENPREGEPGDAETYSEPVASADPDPFAARLATQLVCARARIGELETALLEAQGQLCAEHCEWTGSGDHDDQCMKLSKVLTASPAAQGKETRKP